MVHSTHHTLRPPRPRKLVFPGSVKQCAMLIPLVLPLTIQSKQKKKKKHHIPKTAISKSISYFESALHISLAHIHLHRESTAPGVVQHHEEYADIHLPTNTPKGQMIERT